MWSKKLGPGTALLNGDTLNNHTSQHSAVVVNIKISGQKSLQIKLTTRFIGHMQEVEILHSVQFLCTTDPSVVQLVQG